MFLQEAKEILNHTKFPMTEKLLAIAKKHLGNSTDTFKVEYGGYDKNKRGTPTFTIFYLYPCDRYFTNEEDKNIHNALNEIERFIKSHREYDGFNKETWFAGEVGVVCWLEPKKSNKLNEGWRTAVPKIAWAGTTAAGSAIGLIGGGVGALPGAVLGSLLGIIFGANLYHKFVVSPAIGSAKAKMEILENELEECKNSNMPNIKKLKCGISNQKKARTVIKERINELSKSNDKNKELFIKTLKGFLRNIDDRLNSIDYVINKSAKKYKNNRYNDKDEEKEDVDWALDKNYTSS